MSLLREDFVRRRAQLETVKMHKAATVRLDESVARKADSFDIFLSHSIRDAEIVDGVRLLLEDKGFSVYVDWRVDANLPRDHVTPATAEVLRHRMNQSRSLLYLHSSNSADSKWMPWELGYFDGKNGRVAILPLVKEEDDEFKQQEYLGLYPVVDVANSNKGDKNLFWVNAPLKRREYEQLMPWISGAHLSVHP